MWHSVLPWDTPIIQSLLPIWDVWRVRIYTVWDNQAGQEDVQWQHAEGRKHHPVFPNLQNRDDAHKLVARMPYDQAPREWEIHIHEYMGRNGNDQCPPKYCTRDIITSMRRFRWQPAYAEHPIHTPHLCFNSNVPLNCLYTEMHTADCWQKTQVK